MANADLLPAPKTLSQRITYVKMRCRFCKECRVANPRYSQPKAQPKSAATDKHTGANAKTAAAGKGPNKKRGKPRSARPAKKTAEELDSEMADYFEAGAANGENTNGAAPAAAATGDAPMEDEIM